jgi:mannosyltransferase
MPTSAPPPARAPRNSIPWGWGLLGVILVLAACLRFYNLGGQSLWNDELESWRQSSFATLGEVIRQGVLPDTNSPGFQIILFGVEKWIGQGEAELRLPSAVSGLLTVALIFVAGRRLWGMAEGLMAALMAAVLWAPVYYSQEARSYALVTLMSLGASVFWLDLMRSIGRQTPLGKGTWLGFIVFAVASAYIHYFGLLLVTLEGAALLAATIFTRRSRRVAAVSLGLVGLGFAPWIPSMLQQSTHTDKIAWIPTPTLRAFPAFISFGFNGHAWLAIVVVGLLGWLVWDLFSRVRRAGRLHFEVLWSTPEVLVGYWLIGPILVAYLMSVWWTPLLTQRNLLVSLPALYLLTAHAVTRLPVPGLAQTGLIAGLGIFALFDLVFTMGYYTQPQKEQFREVVKYAVTQCPLGPSTSIIGYANFPDYFDYYFRQARSPLRVQLLAGEDQDVDRLKTFLAANRPARICFISAHRLPDNGFLEAFRQSFTLIDHRGFFMADFRLFKLKGS